MLREDYYKLPGKTQSHTIFISINAKGRLLQVTWEDTVTHIFHLSQCKGETITSYLGRHSHTHFSSQSMLRGDYYELPGKTQSHTFFISINVKGDYYELPGKTQSESCRHWTQNSHVSWLLSLKFFIKYL